MEEVEHEKTVKAGKSLLADGEPKQKKAVTFQKQAETIADYVIDVDTQITFITNCKFYKNDAPRVQILNWNMVGTCSVRNELHYSTVDVEFTNRNFHKNLSIRDDFGVSMASMNYSGVILASQTEEKNDDEYENDVVDDHDNEEVDELARRRKNSNIMF